MYYSRKKIERTVILKRFFNNKKADERLRHERKKVSMKSNLVSFFEEWNQWLNGKTFLLGREENMSVEDMIPGEIISYIDGAFSIKLQGQKITRELPVGQIIDGMNYYTLWVEYYSPFSNKEKASILAAYRKFMIAYKNALKSEEDPVIRIQDHMVWEMPVRVNLPFKYYR